MSVVSKCAGLDKTIDSTVIDGCGCCDSPYGNRNEQQSAADLRLICAAPELLAELEHVVFFYDQLKPEDLARAKAVIAKATGEGA